MADTYDDSGESAIDPGQDDDGDQDADAAQAEEDILLEAKARFKIASEAESDIRRLALEDLEFRAGEQWPQNIQQDRERDGRPCLVINRLPQFVQQVTNDQRQNRPSIKVHPVGDGADVDTAKKIQGLIRHIEYNSNAEVAYDTAFESAATSGYGYFRIVTDFVSPDSFDQEILIKRIRNPFSVYFDPSSQEPDGSDANWGFIVDQLTRDEYKAQYPGSKMASMSDWKSIGDQDPSWMSEDGTATVVEYLYKVFENKKVHLLSTGETIEDAKLKARLAEAQQAGIPATVIKSKVAKVPVVKWCKLNAVEILDETVFPSKYIPIIPVYGTEIYVDGRRILEGVIRNAKDAQRMYNYWKSAETEAIALAPKTPFIVAEGQIEDYKDQWENANRRNHAYLPYKPTANNGLPVPPPQRQSFEPAVQAITQAAMYAADDLKATTGIYDASLGAQSSDSSGIAIQRRNMQAQTSNFHFMDNLSRSLRHAGRIIVDVIPKIYDTARSSRIVAEDGTQEIVKFNQPTGEKGPNGEDVIYRLDTGQYDATVDVGPSFASKRQEAAAAMQEMTRAAPQLLNMIGDLMVKNMDWNGAQEMAERLHKMLPPQLQDDGKNKQIPPQVQAQMQQQGMLIEHLTTQLKGVTEDLKMKRLDLEHKERIEVMRIQADLEKTLATLGSKESIALMTQEIGAIKHRLELLNTNAPIGAEDQASLSSGGSPAQAGPEASQPTGGSSPGLPVE